MVYFKKEKQNNVYQWITLFLFLRDNIHAIEIDNHFNIQLPLQFVECIRLCPVCNEIYQLILQYIRTRVKCYIARKHIVF